jgi:NAD+ diphosphatase
MSSFPELGPQPSLGYTQNTLDRAVARRSEPSTLAAMEADENARVYVIGGELIALKKSADTSEPLFTPSEADELGPIHERVFLGLAGGAARFGVAANPAALEQLKARNEFFVADLRSIAVQGLVAPDHLPPLAEAKALLSWHMRHQFCANCGAKTKPVDGGWRRHCDVCSVEHFPRTDPVVIMLAIDGERCLLGRQSRFPPRMWSCLAGFVEPGESLEEAVRRETFEEAGIECGRVVYFASQPWPFPMSLMIGCFAQALSRNLVVDHTELESARWFERAEVAKMLVRQHPDGATAPPPVAIAYHIARAWVEQGDAVFH